MRVLVTGGAGFIGSHIVDALVDDSHEVSVVDDLTSGREADLNPGARLFNVDITHYDALHRAFEEARPEVVYHLAAQSTVARSMEDPYGDSLVNVGGTINVLRLCVKSGAGRIIFASSSAVYGDPSYVPMDETHPVNPRSGYGISKSTAERYVKLFSDTHGLPYKLFRCGNVYGPRQMPGGEAGVIAIFAGQMLRGTRPTIFGDGRKTRDYVYVGDVVRANLLAMDGRGRQRRLQHRLRRRGPGHTDIRGGQTGVGLNDGALVRGPAAGRPEPGQLGLLKSRGEASMAGQRVARRRGAALRGLAPPRHGAVTLLPYPADPTAGRPRRIRHPSPPGRHRLCRSGAPPRGSRSCAPLPLPPRRWSISTRWPP